MSSAEKKKITLTSPITWIKNVFSHTESEEIVFLVEQEADGTYTAHSKDHSIFTFGDSVDSLKHNIKDAISCHFDDQEADKKTYKLQFSK